MRNIEQGKVEIGDGREKEEREEEREKEREEEREKEREREREEERAPLIELKGEVEEQGKRKGKREGKGKGKGKEQDGSEIMEERKNTENDKYLPLSEVERSVEVPLSPSPSPPKNLLRGINSTGQTLAVMVMVIKELLRNVLLHLNEDTYHYHHHRQRIS